MNPAGVTFLSGVFLKGCFSWCGCWGSSPQTLGVAQVTEPMSQHKQAVSVMLDVGCELLSGVSTGE